MKFTTRTAADTDLAALADRLFVSETNADKAAAVQQLQAANPELLRPALAAAFDSLILLPDPGQPPFNPDASIAGTTTVAAHELAVVHRALDELETSGDAEQVRAGQALGILQTLLPFQQDPDHQQYIQSVTDSLQSAEMRLDQVTSAQKNLKLLTATLRADLDALLAILP